MAAKIPASRGVGATPKEPEHQPPPNPTEAKVAQVGHEALVETKQQDVQEGAGVAPGSVVVSPVLQA